MKKLALIIALLMLTACTPASKAEKAEDNNAQETVIKLDEKEQGEKNLEESKKQEEPKKEPTVQHIKVDGKDVKVEENLEAKGIVKEVDHKSHYLILETKDGDIRFDEYNKAIITSTHERTIGPEKINVKDELLISYMKWNDKTISNGIKNLSNTEGSSVFIPVEEKQEFEEKYQQMAYEALYKELLETRQKDGEFLIVYPQVVDRFEDENVLKLYTISNYSWYVLWDTNELEEKSGASGGYVVIEYTKNGDELKFKKIHTLEFDGALTEESLKKLVVDKPDAFDKYKETQNTSGSDGKDAEVKKLLDKHGYKYKLIKNY